MCLSIAKNRSKQSMKTLTIWGACIRKCEEERIYDKRLISIRDFYIYTSSELQLVSEIGL